MNQEGLGIVVYSGEYAVEPWLLGMVLDMSLLDKQEAASRRLTLSPHLHGILVSRME